MSLHRQLGGARPGHPHFSVYKPLPALQAALWQRINSEVLARQTRPQEGARLQVAYDARALKQNERAVDPTARVRKGGAQHRSVLGSLHGAVMNMSSKPAIAPQGPVADAEREVAAGPADAMASSAWRAVRTAVAPPSNKRAREADEDVERVPKVAKPAGQKESPQDAYAPGPPKAIQALLPNPKTAMTLPADMPPPEPEAPRDDAPRPTLAARAAPAVPDVEAGAKHARKPKRVRKLGERQRERLAYIASLIKEKKMSLAQASKEASAKYPASKLPSLPKAVRTPDPVSSPAPDGTPVAGAGKPTRKPKRARSDKQKARDEQVRKVMKEFKLSLAAANKYVKEHMTSVPTV